jgi:general secretion pathway protein G
VSRPARREGRASPTVTTTALTDDASHLAPCGVHTLTTRVTVGLARPSRRAGRFSFGRGAHPYHARLEGQGLGNQGGFTLIELLVVIIVLGLLVGLVGPRLFGRVGQSKQAAARAQIELLGAALDQYRLDVGAYPNSGQGLDSLQRNPNVPNWNGPYLKKAVPKDPWGNQYKYRCCPGQNGEYDLWSEGSDGAPGGEGESADVTSWEAGQK